MIDKEHISSEGFVVKKRYNNLREKPCAKRMMEFIVMALLFSTYFIFGLLGFWLPVAFIYTLLKYLNIVMLHVFGSGIHGIPTEVQNYERIILPALIGWVIVYAAHWCKDRGAENRGGHLRPWLRSLSVWNYAADYFPIQLILSRELCMHSNADPNISQKREVILGSGFHGLATDQNYLVGYHPHGISGFGSLLNFATDATGFPQAFPGIASWLAIHKMHFRSPFYRESFLSLVGAPILCERTENPTRKQITEVKQRYLNSLRQLFEKYKKAYDPDAGDIEFI
ncbi:hypothetical protein FBUS_06746 [Fasciolopsis buskii]|uniref:Acyltransferase n=1 Tax=Fasciolopsis buskii TaxID=27845 RepID=A0A8E0RJ33_9TREM|nr:hypothetical protein FBUS_06746 [Fasciolopsis buski]